MDFWICWLKKDLLQRNRGDREEEKSAENESFWQILCFQDNIGAFGKTVVCNGRRKEIFIIYNFLLYKSSA